MDTNRLAEIRKKKNITQEELAEKSGVSRVTIANIERGALKDVKISTTLKIANALDEPLENIFCLNS